MAKKYFIYLVTAMFVTNIFFVNSAAAEVCLQDPDAVDVATLLDASERDLDLLGNCEKLVKDLYQQLDERDKQVKSLTKELVEAKQDVIKYKASAEKWRKVAWYTTAAGVVIVVLKILPAL